MGFAEGSACGLGKAKCATCAVAEITHVTFFFNGVRECSAFQFFLRGGVFYFFLDRIVCRQVGLLVCVENKTKLSAVFRFSVQYSQDVKGRWFSCYVDGCSVVF